MIRAGAMRHRVRLEQRAAPSNGEALSTTWTLFKERWAAIEATTGRETIAAQQVNAVVPTVFRLRYLDGVSPAMRVVYGGRWFAIISAVDMDGRKSELLLTTEERVGVAT